MEIIIIKNFTDPLPFMSRPVKIITLGQQDSYSETINKIARDTKGDLLVILKNIWDISSAWLSELIHEKYNNDNCGMIGSWLRFEESASSRISRLNKIRFSDTIIDNNYYLSFDIQNIDSDELILNDTIPASCICGNCFLIDRTVFLSVNGFDTLLADGFEGIDLSLKLYKAGYKNYIAKNVCAFCSQQLQFEGENYTLFRLRWQSYLARKLFTEKLDNQHLLTKQNFCIGIIESAAESIAFSEFLQECQQLGYELKYISGNFEQGYNIGAEVDLLIFLDQFIAPESINNTKDNLHYLFWDAKNNLSFENFPGQINYNIVFNENTSQLFEIKNGNPCPVSYHPAALLAAIIRILKKQNQFTLDENSIDILGGMPTGDEKYHWGDYHYAKSLANEFRKRGYNVNIKCYPQWAEISNSKYVLLLRGIHPYYPKIEGGQKIIMWNISHPADVSTAEYNLCDLVYIASEKIAKTLSTEISVPVHTLMQCTDENSMTYTDNPDKQYELLFIGNSRGIFRKILKDLLPTEHNLTVYGRAWDTYIPKKYIAGIYYDNSKVGQAYHDAKILLNDHYDDMREFGFISNRLFDALAAEAFVISDNIPEIEKIFNGAVVTYENREDLKQKIDYYLEHPEERDKKAKIGRQIVLAKHTFSHRVDTIIADIKKYDL